ncbi:response regulator [bacterium]|nr:response regulator [bacterium]
MTEESKKDRYSILIVDDEETILRMFKNQFRKDYDITTCNSAEEALEVLKQQQFTVIISDQKMPGMKGVDFLVEVKNKHPDSIRMLLTGYADAKVARDAINKGQVTNYIDKPWEKDKFKEIINLAIEQHELTLGKMMTFMEMQLQTQLHKDFKDAGLRIDKLSPDEKQKNMNDRMREFCQYFDVKEKEYIIEHGYIIYPRTPTIQVRHEISSFLQNKEIIEQISKAFGEECETEIMEQFSSIQFWYPRRKLWEKQLRLAANLSYQLRAKNSISNFDLLVSNLNKLLEVAELIEKHCNLSFRGERLRFSVDPLYFFGTLDPKKHNDDVLAFDRFLYGQPTSLAGYLVSSTVSGLKKNILKEKDEFFQKTGTLS